ncbi:WecB/TagA/CpsF family glycosyltransferase [Stenotrophomonas sp. Betaine-02u-23]|uniref:WecB/TagA/CpsF family glycosyltransferase n=2 Tax=Stenotrophomonas TaxID=40323 RepID=UPI001E31AE83|nr:WecB/TagA/CpsF family glycosyltransferase [Stenotrophomonas sp. Betaine-02u-23]
MNNRTNGSARVMGTDLKHVRFGDFSILCASRQDLVDLALEDCSARPLRTKVVFDANGHALSLAKTNPAFRKMIGQADIIHADGGFLVTLSKRLNLNPIPERSATTDMLHDFASAFQATPHSFYLLGSEERVNAGCAAELKAMYPNLKIAGRRNGFFSADEEQRIVDDINASGADVLWVGLGKPKEQEFCLRWRDQLKPAWTVTCGGCFNYVTGDYARAPNWMQQANIEWIHRLGTRPKEMLGRYLKTTPHALWIALTDNSSRDRPKY